MLGLILACGWAAFASPRFLPDELPPNIDNETRAELIAKWQKGYTVQLKKVRAAMDDAEALMKFPQSAREGRALMAVAKNDLVLMRKTPERTGGVFQRIYDKPAAGMVGVLREPHAVVSSVRPNGFIVEVVLIFNASKFGGIETGDKRVARYYVADSLRVKKSAKLALDGVWYVAGNIEIGGKQMPVLYRFEIKPDEVPK